MTADDLTQAHIHIQMLEAELAQHKADAETFRIEAEKYHNLFQYSSDSILIVEADTGTIIDLNQETVRCLGYAPDALIGRPLAEIELRRDVAPRPPYSDKTQVYECIYRRSDGTMLPVEVKSRLVAFDGQQVVLKTVRSTVRRKRLEEMLRLYERVVEQSTNSIMITNTAAQIEYVNPHVFQLTGYTREEVIGQNPRILQSGLTDPKAYADLWQAIAAGGQWKGEFINRKKDGSFYWEEATISAIRNEEGQITHYVAVKQDVTERKHAEEERTRLINELDAFAHTVAHDLKNPVAALIGLIEVLEEESIGLSLAQMSEVIQHIRQVGYKMNSIINSLLLFASVRQLDQVPIAPLNMGQVLREATHRVLDLFNSSGAEVKLEAPEGWPTALGYAPWIEEVWVNYLSNAVKYGGLPPQITIGASPQGEDSVLFWVRDNGTGISPEALPTLFQEFTRLQPSRTEGHGLGLSIVQRIVTRLNGTVSAESILGEGSTFGFTLPKSLNGKMPNP